MYNYVVHRIHIEVNKMINNKNYISPLLHSMFRELSLEKCLILALHYHISMDKFPIILFQCFHISNYVGLKYPTFNKEESFLFRV